MSLADSALLDAAGRGDVEGVRAALARGADVNARKDTSGSTAVMRAASTKHADVVAVLVCVACRSRTCMTSSHGIHDVWEDGSVRAEWGGVGPRL